MESQVSLQERGVLLATLQWLHLACGSLRDGADLKEAAVDFGDCGIASVCRLLDTEA
jgi:hypothetical protein